MLKEIVLWKPPFAFANTIRVDLDLWTNKTLSLSWMLSPEAKDILLRRKNVVKEYFQMGHDSKNGRK
jgi:hypothetical protein